MKGLGEARILFWRALRNALIPTATLVGVQFGFLIGGTVLIETIFAWPGIGQLTLQAFQYRDFPLIQGIVLVYAVTVILSNLAVDVAYAFLNPARPPGGVSARREREALGGRRDRAPPARPRAGRPRARASRPEPAGPGLGPPAARLGRGRLAPPARHRQPGPRHPLAPPVGRAGGGGRRGGERGHLGAGRGPGGARRRLRPRAGRHGADARGGRLDVDPRRPPGDRADGRPRASGSGRWSWPS